MPCPSGSYKTLDGRQSPCTPCPPNTASLPGSTNLSACQCMQDQTEAPDGTCSPCPPGTYKNGLGAGQCTYSELALQETLMADWLVSESRKRPFCIPGSHMSRQQTPSPLAASCAMRKTADDNQDMTRELMRSISGRLLQDRIGAGFPGWSRLLGPLRSEHLVTIHP